MTELLALSFRAESVCTYPCMYVSVPFCYCGLCRLIYRRVIHVKGISASPRVKCPSKHDRMEDTCHFPSYFTHKTAGNVCLYCYETVWLRGDSCYGAGHFQGQRMTYLGLGGVWQHGEDVGTNKAVAAIYNGGICSCFQPLPHKQKHPF